MGNPKLPRLAPDNAAVTDLPKYGVAGTYRRNEKCGCELAQVDILTVCKLFHLAAGSRKALSDAVAC
jgi:hypothetical protein